MTQVTKEKQPRKINFRSIIAKILLLLVIVFLLCRIYMLLTTSGEYMITTQNYFDYQKHLECSGYASAYVLRSLGIESDGKELYYSFEDKNPDGTLAPGYLWENLKNMGYNSSLCIGSVTDLKYAVNKGVPVIVLIRVNTSQSYLHYVPVVGYDKDYIYVADSLSYLVNADEPYFNRQIPIEEFKTLWKTDTFAVNNIYITIKE